MRLDDENIALYNNARTGFDKDPTVGGHPARSSSMAFRHTYSTEINGNAAEEILVEV